jgi:hypothetical protein
MLTAVLDVHNRELAQATKSKADKTWMGKTSHTVSVLELFRFRRPLLQFAIS